MQNPISNNAFQNHTPWPISNNAFQHHLHCPIQKQAFARPSLPQLLIPRPVKPCLARPSVLAGPPLPHHLGKLTSWILYPPGVKNAFTVFPSEEDLLLHMSTLVPLPSVCAKVETQMPAEPCSALTTPSTASEELEVEAGLFRLPDQYCLVLTSPQVAYHLQ